ncbi:hypothetical protein PCANC_19199 [Puccinia coronata f. sp. avenae]|uniref:Transmembrane protein n=1 Tax=Puccinia coronata f. sp. avenae TaxID=200324 RepID=A0A2N5T9X5_9BASI|nr:hypothetical protein PCANC_19199 [Puccinia coronata f. sp. avenae]PLW22303.1 hypothetical protein PCASD_15303 [Puccinia coronata f. sp. avenae]
MSTTSLRNDTGSTELNPSQLTSENLIKIFYSRNGVSADSPLIALFDRIISEGPSSSSKFFRTLIQVIRQTRFPPVPTSTYVLLIFFSVLNFLVLVVLLVTLIWPMFHYTSTQRLQRCWLFKLHPIKGPDGNQFGSTRLILVNSAVLTAISQIIQSSLTQVYIYLNYFASQSTDFADNVPLTPWACGITLFQFYSCWFLAWNSLYISMLTRNPYLDPLGKIRKKTYILFHPVILNTFFIILPVLVTMGSSFMVYELTTASHHLSRRWQVLNGILKAGTHCEDALYTNDTGLSASETAIFQRDFITSIVAFWRQGLQVAKILDDNIRKDRVESLTWVIVMSVTCCIYTYSYWVLVGLISSGIRKCNKRVEIGLVSASVPSRSSGHHCQLSGSPVPTNRGDPAAQVLADSIEQGNIVRGFRHFALYGLVMILAMLSTITVRLIFVIKAPERLWYASWRSIGCWLTLISSAFLGLANTFQCIRTIMDFEIIIPTPRSPISNRQNSAFEPSQGHRDECSQLL